MVDAQIIITRTSDGSVKIAMVGGPSLLDHLAEDFKLGQDHGSKVSLRAEFFEDDPLLATSPMYAYLWGHLAVVLLRYLKSAGWTINSKELAVEHLKAELGFTESIYDGAGNVFVVPLSISRHKGVSRKRIAQFVEDLKIWLLDHGCRVMTPDEYKRNQELKIES